MGSAGPVLNLSAGDYALTVAPAIGGSIRSFTWRGEPLMRTARDNSVLDAACFPLVPFSNRIARGRFEWMGKEVQLAPNFPGTDHPHPLHGFGWLSEWDLIEADGNSAVLEHRYHSGEWPWPYVARQHFSLTEQGLALELSLINLSDSIMPAGLGFHPYFVRNKRTMLCALHKGEWQNDVDCLPAALSEGEHARDWWQGRPVDTRLVDNVYTDRQGAILIDWPDRDLCLKIECDQSLNFTSIFVPEGQNWFCAEPVSHSTNALNHSGCKGELHALEPSEQIRACVSFMVVD